MVEELKHFSHIHGLVSHHIPIISDHQYTSTSTSSNYYCSGCKSPASGHLYVCWKCNYFLHQQCFIAPRSLNHPSHPLHPLTLYPFPTYPSASFICNSCHLPGNAFSYACSACDFDIHLHCALTHPYPNPNPNIPNPSFNSHPQLYPPPPVNAHPLPNNYPNYQTALYPPPVPAVSNTSNNYNNVPPSNPLAPNPPPNYNNTITIPPPPPPHQLNQIDPTPPPQNPIPPQPNPPNPTLPTYSTVVNATTTDPPPQTPSSSLIKHFSHPHVLKAMEIDKTSAKVCSACECELSGSAFCCTDSHCTFNLHKSCFDSPLEVKHKSHLQHPLKLLTAPPYKDGFTCNACLKDGKAFAYTCEACSYDLHIDCIQWPDTVIRPDHNHPLTLYYSSPAAATAQDDVIFMCDVCKNPVHEMAWVYYCRECDFGTHLECIASGVKTEGGGGSVSGAKSEEELVKEMELKFAVLQLLLGGGGGGQSPLPKKWVPKVDYSSLI